jgi:hypothetical protein
MAAAWVPRLLGLGCLGTVWVGITGARDDLGPAQDPGLLRQHLARREVDDAGPEQDEAEEGDPVGRLGRYRLAAAWVPRLLGLGCLGTVWVGITGARDDLGPGCPGRGRDRPARR